METQLAELISALSALAGCTAEFAQRPFLFEEALDGKMVEFDGLQQSFFYRIFRGPDNGNEYSLSAFVNHLFCRSDVRERSMYERGLSWRKRRVQRCCSPPFQGIFHQLTKAKNKAFRMVVSPARTWKSDSLLSAKSRSRCS